MTIAAQLAKNFNNVAGVEKKNSNASAVAITAVTKNWVTVSSGKYGDAIIDAAAHLDNGNEAEGIDAYPDDQRCVIIRPTAKAAMIKAISQLNGGAAVFDMLKRGGVDADSRPKIATTGYIGEFMNMPVYVASNVTFTLVEKYLGLAAGSLANLAGLVVSAVGTGRALAFNSTIKQIPSPNGQGKVIGGIVKHIAAKKSNATVLTEIQTVEKTSNAQTKAINEQTKAINALAETDGQMVAEVKSESEKIKALAGAITGVNTALRCFIRGTAIKTELKDEAYRALNASDEQCDKIQS